MESLDLTKLSEYRENNGIEAKKSKGGLPRSLWETYSSFANTKGGIILLGVIENEDKSLQATGIDNPEKMCKDFWDSIHNKITVNVNILKDDDVKICMVGGVPIIAITVPAASRTQKPVYVGKDMFEGTYRRDFEGDYRCSRKEVLAMLRDQSNESGDEKLLDVPVEELNGDTVSGYRNAHRSLNPNHPFLRNTDDEYLRSIGAASVSREDGKMYATAAGLLMFGNEYDIVREYPDYFLDYREQLDPSIRWTDRYFSSSGRWSGNVFDFYYGTYNKIAVTLKTPFHMEGMYRQDDTPVHKAIREALVNTLTNADYHESRGVVIIRNQQGITFENPGGIRIGKSQMLMGGVSDPRNRTLLKMFNLIDIGERSGSGVPNIFNVWEDEGLKEPEITEQNNPDRTILRLTFAKRVPKKSSEKEFSERIKAHREIIIGFMEDEREYKLSEIAPQLNVGERQVRKIVKTLVQSGDIIETGSTKGKTYKKVVK